MRFLIVSKHQLIRSLLRQILKNNHYKDYFIARDGREALSLTRKLNIDLVICDWDLPYINGIEMLKIMKEEPDNFLIPFIMLSAVQFEERYLYALEEGADGCVPIPFTEKTIIYLVDRIIDRQENPNPNQAFINQMRRLKFQKDHNQLISLGYEFLAANNDIQAALLTSESLYKKRELKKAEEILKKATTYGENSKVYDLLGKINLDKSDDIKSLSYFRKAHEINPLNTDRQMFIARNYLKRGDLATASDVLRKILNNKPTYMTIINIGKMYLEHGYVKEASKYMENINPIMETAELFYMFTIRLWQIGLKKKCVELLRQYINALPNCHYYYFHLGVILMRNKQYKKAERLIKRALEIDPDYEPARKCIEMIKSCNYG